MPPSSEKYTHANHCKSARVGLDLRRLWQHNELAIAGNSHHRVFFFLIHRTTTINNQLLWAAVCIFAKLSFVSQLKWKIKVSELIRAVYYYIWMSLLELTLPLICVHVVCFSTFPGEDRPPQRPLFPCNCNVKTLTYTPSFAADYTEILTGIPIN